MCCLFRALLQLGMDNIYSLLDTKQRAMLRTLSPLENETIDKLFKEVREKQNALCIPMQESLRKIIALNAIVSRLLWDILQTKHLFGGIYIIG